MVVSESTLHRPRVWEGRESLSKCHPSCLPVSAPAVVTLPLFSLFSGLPPLPFSLQLINGSVISDVMVSFQSGLGGAGVRPRLAFRIKAQFIPKGLLVGLPSDTIVPHGKLPPWKGSEAASRWGIGLELGEGRSRPGCGQAVGEHSGARQKGPTPNCLGPGPRGTNSALLPRPPNGASEEGPRLSMLTLGLNIHTHLFKQTY